MNAATRAFFAGALLGFVVTAGLHAAVLFGWTVAWPALVHAALFAWITSMVLGVVHHVVPVFSGRALPSPTGGAWAAGAWTLGWSAVVAGLLLSSADLLVAGSLLEFAAALAAVLHVSLGAAYGRVSGHRPPPSPDAEQARVDRVASYATRIACPCLPGAVLLMTVSHLGWIDGAWALAGRHLAALGWLSLMVVGVGWHVLPRFSGQSTRGRRLAAGILGLQSLGTALVVLSLGLGWSLPLRLGALMAAVALVTFAWTVLPTLRAVPPRTPFVTISRTAQ